MKSVFNGKSVLLTGHTGFKGSWLCAWLNHLGARVSGISLEPPSNPFHFEVAEMNEWVDDQRADIRNYDAIKKIILKIQPNFVFHMAAQPLVRRSYVDPIETYETNVLGTLHVLEALRALEKPCVAVLITSDKCYDNVEWVWAYRETDLLGGPDPYSASKGAAELVIRSHVRSFFPADGAVRIGIGRAGNVVGGGDWGTDRIVPDCMKAWSCGEHVKLRNPNATRPWQHVLEPLSGYLTLAMALAEEPSLHGEPFNFGPSAQQNHSVLELVQEMAIYWDQVRWHDESLATLGPYESDLLKLNCDKALHHLNWQACMTFEETVRLTAEWYRIYYQDIPNMAEVTIQQITEYTANAVSKGLAWVQ